MIWCQAVTLELRKLEAGAREKRHKMQDGSNSRRFYRQHLEQERGVTCPIGGKEVMDMWGYLFLKLLSQTYGQTRVADSAETIICSAETMVSLLNYTSVAGPTKF